MRSHASPEPRALKRHQLVYLHPSRWDDVLRRQPETDSVDPFVRSWAHKDWPLVARRPLPHETGGIPLGIPLPPSAGKRRVPIVVQPEDILAIHEPGTLASARGQAPEQWQRIIDLMQVFAADHHVELQVFGSLAWQSLTGLQYLSETSDIDVLLRIHLAADIDLLSSEISRIDNASPSRIDGEFVRPDGLGVNWREFLSDPMDVLVKSMEGVTLFDRKRFVAGDSLP